MAETGMSRRASRDAFRRRTAARAGFYGRVSTEDWQDPVISRARQRAQAEALVRGHGRAVAEFFDSGQSRPVAWAQAAGRRPGGRARRPGPGAGTRSSLGST